MRLRVVSRRSEITNLGPNETMIHLAFRASIVDFLNLVHRCPRLRLIQMPSSYRKTLSDAIGIFSDMQGIELLEGDVWGHRKDIDEYFIVEDTTIKEILTLIASGVTMDEVAAQIQKNARISPDLVKYIADTRVTA